jgi:hypothetical protein
MQRRAPHASTSAKTKQFSRATQQPLSQMRFAVKCVLVRTMFWDWQVGQARVQGVRGDGKDDNLPECPRTQTAPFWLDFSQGEPASPAGRRRLNQASTSRLDISFGTKTRIRLFRAYVSFHQDLP